MAQTSPDTPGRRLISGGLAFWRAAKLLHEYDREALAWAACFVNLGFAIELGLKGFLREKGLTPAEQKGLGHDLVRAFDKAVEYGFRQDHPIKKVVVTDISPHFADMSLRYLVGMEVILPRIDTAIEVVSDLLHDLYKQSFEP